ncbi:MAG: 6-phosphogluconolactonase [Magnetococcales bacterium]|nr:6-phosphogluconolactonase [Magnetococcales bacterium]
MEARSFSSEQWAVEAAGVIRRELDQLLRKLGRCTVMLTGGRSAACLYAAWSRFPEFSSLSGVQFLFGDERCVAPDHPDSNFGMVMGSLFVTGIPEGCSVRRMEAESRELEAAADRYAALLPERVDLLLLGVGEDGHVASLFPFSSALHETKRLVVPITGPKPPPCRLTVTPPVIRSARRIFVLASGEGKSGTYPMALREPDQWEAFPVRLATSAVWLMDNLCTGCAKRYIFSMRE